MKNGDFLHESLSFLCHNTRKQVKKRHMHYDLCSFHCYYMWVPLLLLTSLYDLNRGEKRLKYSKNRKYSGQEK